MGKRVAIKDIILSFRQTGNVSKTARELGISRWTVYRWVKRCASISQGHVKTYIYQGIQRKSTKPHHVFSVLPFNLRDEIINLRNKEHAGARKIYYMIGKVSSHMTIHRLLRKKNLVSIQKNYRRPLFQNGHAMRPANTKALGYLQMDTKHVTPELSGLGYTVYEYAAIDIISRYKAAIILPEINDESASFALEYFLKCFPFEVTYIQTDNGLEFQRSFQEFCDKKNIKHYFIHKNSPNENAVVERAFKTDQDEFYYWLDNQPEHIGELNDWLQKFMLKYNTQRFHQALGYKRPIEIVQMLQMS